MKKNAVAFGVPILSAFLLALAIAQPFFDPSSDLTEKEDQEVDTVSYRVEEVVTGLQVPWDIAFTSLDRILVTERSGNLRVIKDGVLVEKPLHIFSEVSSVSEEGLMSVVLDPAYNQNDHLYLCLAYPQKKEIRVKVVRFLDKGDHLADEKILLDDIPAAPYHAGCRLRFGPDNKLYITTGDATDRQIAQDLNSLGGKILRINSDGTIPSDNPFPDSPVWSYGHRNPQGIAWNALSGELYSTEHGPSGFDGPGGGDEVNHIIKGGNYGWPLVSHEKEKDGTIIPLITYTPAEAPGSLMIYSGKIFPQFEGNLFFGALRGEGLMRIVLDDSGHIIFSEKIAEIKFGRIRAVIEGPDGFIYFSTSNRDGRGRASEKDDRIFRIKNN